MNSKRLTLLVSFLLAISMIITACKAKPTPENVATAEATQEVIEPTATTEPQPAVQTKTEEPAAAENTLSKDLVFDPSITGDEAALKVNGMVYETLVTLDNGQPAPGLALSWTVSEDQLDYIFTLRPNVKFHDGSALGADAVLENFNRWFDPEHPLHGDSARYGFWKDTFLGFKGERTSDNKPVSTFDGIEKVDNLTVLIHLSRPVPEFLSLLSDPHFAMASPAAMAEAGENYGKPGTTVAGTGPYMVKSFTEAELVLEPFAEYWGEKATETLTYTLK